MRSLLWRPGHTAQSMVAAVENRLVPLVPTASPPVTSSTVTSGTADYGSWVEMNAATPVDWYGFSIYMPTGTSALHTNGASNPVLLDVGIGAASSEVAILSGVDVSSRQFLATAGLMGLEVPYLFVPKGSRVAIRISSSTTSQTVALAMNGYTPADPHARVRRIATASAFVTPSSQRGVAVAAGASWTQIVASTPLAAEALLLGIGSSDTLVSAGGNRQVDLAFGAAGAETQVWSTIVRFDTNEDVRMGSTFVPIGVPAGTRISARVQTEPMSMTIHGLS